MFTTFPAPIVINRSPFWHFLTEIVQSLQSLGNSKHRIPASLILLRYLLKTSQSIGFTGSIDICEDTWSACDRASANSF